MIISTSESLKIFAVFLVLGVTLALLFRLLSFCLTKFIYVLFPDRSGNSETTESKINKLSKLKKIKVNKKLIVNMFSALVVFGLFCWAFFVLALHLNFMIAATLIGFYFTYKLSKLKLIKPKKQSN